VLTLPFRVTHLLHTYGLALVFLLVGVESAGVPVPGETALVSAAVLASTASPPFAIEWVIVVAAAAAILGDNAGYWIGRTGGRELLERWEPIARHTRRILPPAERFFAKHGGKTVFLGRFVAFLRIATAWVAGIGRMPWWRFFLWNAAGGICWATAVGLVAYYAGKSAADAISRYGFYGVGAVAVLASLVFGGLLLWRRRTAARLEG
jgi:membrane protein DedA with SNARE-associated domain